MKYHWYVLFGIICTLGQTSMAQHYLNIVGDHGGQTGQSMGFICMADSNYIYTLGDFTDSVRTNIWPYIAAFDYNGILIYEDTVSGYHLIKKNFRMRKFKPIHKKGTNFYYVGIQFDYSSGTKAFNYLMELDVRTGKIIKHSSTQIGSVFKESNFGLIYYINYNNNNTLTMITHDGTRTQDSTKKYVQIIEMDTNLVIKKHITLYDSTIIPFYIKKMRSGTYEIIGRHEYDVDRQTPIFHMVIDSMGKRLDYDIHPFEGKTEFGWDASAYTVERGKYGRFVISFIHRKDKLKGSKQNINEFPFVMCYSQNFDTLLWETPFLRPHDYVRPRIQISSMAKAIDGSGYVTAGALGFRETYSYGKALAFKVSPQGDSLWARTYISSAYEVADSILFWDLKMITPTPYGYAMTGAISDWHLKKFRSFLLHIDQDGCLVPGCAETNSSTEIANLKKSKSFKIHPNPVGDQMYILSHIASKNRHAIVFYDMNGVVTHRSYIVPEAGGQYIVFLPSNMMSGMYVMNIQNVKGQIIFSERIVKQ